MRERERERERRERERREREREREFAQTPNINKGEVESLDDESDDPSASQKVQTHSYH
jgi:hypothetical protein